MKNKLVVFFGVLTLGLLGISWAAPDSYILSSSATATYLQKSSATDTYLQKSSATATYLQKSSATATYLQLSSAAATYPGLIGGYVPNSKLDSSSVTKLGASISLSGSEVTGNLPIGNLNGGVNASAATFWAGDGSWKSGGNSIYPATSTILSTKGTLSNVGYGFSGDPNTGLSSIAADTLQTIVGGVVTSSHTAAGIISYELQPSFLATNTSSQNNVTGDGTLYDVLYANEKFDQNVDFTNSTFTAPINGRYFFSAQAEMEQLTSAVSQCQIVVKASNREFRHVKTHGNNYTETSVAVAGLVDMDAGDIMSVQVACSGITKVVDVGADGRFTFFSGGLLH